MALVRSVIATGILAGALLAVSVWLNAPPWVAFLAWTGQSMLQRYAGATWFMLPAFGVGTLTAAASVASANAIATSPGWALPLSLGTACALVAMLNAWRRTEPAIAPVFLGMIAWFGVHSADSSLSLGTLLVAAILGIATHQIARAVLALSKTSEDRR